MNEAIDALAPSDFYNPVHRRIFGAMVDLYRSSVEIDPILVGEELKRDGDIAHIGGVAWITSLTMGIPPGTGISTYIKVIRDKAEQRNLLHKTNEIQRKILSGEDLESVKELVADLAPKERPKRLRALEIQTANEALAEALNEPPITRIAGSLVIRYEMTFLIGPTNGGKTLFAVQMAEDSARGFSSLGLVYESKEGLKTLYVDLELSKRQWLKRYSDGNGKPYVFSDNLQRASFNRDCELPANINFETYLLNEILAEVQSRGIELIVIDNLTALISANEKARDAGPFMNRLNRIKAQHNLTIVVIAHTPKRDATKPLLLNDLLGSAVLGNLCDAAFALGKSSLDPDLRYVKQLKVRTSDFEYGADNILLYRLQNKSNFLGYEFDSCGVESDHLATHHSAATGTGGKRMREAKEFLQNELRGGEVLAEVIKQKARDAKIIGKSDILIERASREMGIEKKFGFWSLPKV